MNTFNRITMFYLSVFFSTNIYAGDLRRTVNYPGLASALEAERMSDWFFCGDEKLNIESKHFAEHFFAGPGNRGVVIRGLSGFQLFQWTRTMTADDLSKKIRDAANAATFMIVEKEGLKVSKAKLLSAKVDIPHSHYDCKSSTPENFQCLSQSGQVRPGCCEEGVNKLYRFTLLWGNINNPGQSYKLSYYPGDGNTVVVENGGKGLVRFCATDGMIFVK